MKFFMFYLLLPAFAAAVVTPPVRAQRLNVLSFLNDAFCTTTEKAMTAKITAYSNPPKPMNVLNSEDLSDSKSMENEDTDGFPDTFKDLDSDEVLSREVVAKPQVPLRRMSTDGKDYMQLMDMTKRLILDHEGQKLNRMQGEQASREPTDQDSEEEMRVKAYGNANLQRQATPGIVKVINEKIPQDQSREMPDWDSLEDNNGRLAARDNSKDADYDETREYISSETFPPKPSSLSVPAKSRAA